MVKTLQRNAAGLCGNLCRAGAGPRRWVGSAGSAMWVDYVGKIEGFEGEGLERVQSQPDGPRDYCPDMLRLLFNASLVLVQHRELDLQSLALCDINAWVWLYERGNPKFHWLKTYT